MIGYNLQHRKEIFSYIQVNWKNSSPREQLQINPKQYKINIILLFHFCVFVTENYDHDDFCYNGKKSNFGSRGRILDFKKRKTIRISPERHGSKRQL